MSALEFPIGTGAVDGWVAADPMTYASATTFTVSGDLTAKYSKGTRIKLTQSTDKYFVVAGSSHAAGTTTVTVTAGTDYTLANAAITGPYYSYAENPQGYPGWFAYTPTFTGFSADPTSVVARFSVNGRVVTLNFSSAFGTSNAAGMTVSTPIAGTGFSLVAARVYNSGTVQTTPGLAYVDSATSSGTVVTVTRDMGGSTGFTASGSKTGHFTIDYEI